MSIKKRKYSPDMFKNKVIDRHGKMGNDACQMLTAALEAVDAYESVINNINLKEDCVMIGAKLIPIDAFDRVIVVGFGKASVPMAQAAIDTLGEKISKAVVVTKSEKMLFADGYANKLNVHIGGHPVPTTASIQATNAILSTLSGLSKRDLVLVLISGGGSTLFTKPISYVSLDGLQSMTNTLLKCGADIYEINTLRKHLDEVKGGRLAEKLQPAQIHTLILSDVIGDRLDMIASGPTVADPTSYADAVAVVKKYHLLEKLPVSILRHLDEGNRGLHKETLKPQAMAEIDVTNHLIASNRTAAEAASRKAKALGYHSLIISTQLTGNTCDVSHYLAGEIESAFDNYSSGIRPACLIFGGETTVEVLGEGLGGRNQDLALRMVQKISGKSGLLFITFATDGEDGPTDAAGAAVDGSVLDEYTADNNIEISTFIKNNDAYTFLDKVGGLIRTGSTGTNVNDLVLILFNSD